MDSLLQETSTKVRNKIDEISYLLEFLPLLPTTATDAALDLYTDSTSGVNNKQENDEEGNGTIDTFIKLYDRIRQLESKEGETSEKSKKILASLIVDALSMISTSPLLQQSLRAHNKSSNNNITSISTEDENNDTMIQNDISSLKEYLASVRDIACQKIEISAEKDKSNCTILFKAIDKCTHKLEPHRATLQKIVDSKEKELNQKRNSLQETLSLTKKQIQDYETKAMEEYHKLKESVKIEMDLEKERHDKQMSLLQSELESINSRLSQSTEEHALEQQQLLKACKDTEIQLSSMEQEHAAEVERRMMEITKLKTLLESETLERKELEKKCSLIEENKRIEQEEKRLLQKVVDMESQAEAILFRGAVALQKIIRGVQGRAIAKNMKKAKNKKKKGGTKKKKGSSKKKSIS